MSYKIPLALDEKSLKYSVFAKVYKRDHFLGFVRLIVDTGCQYPLILGGKDAAKCRIPTTGKAVAETAYGLGGGTVRLSSVDGLIIGFMDADGRENKLSFNEAYAHPTDTFRHGSVVLESSVSLLGVKFIHENNLELRINPQEGLIEKL